MLIRLLREYAEERLALPPPMYQEQPIRYIIPLDQAGRMLGKAPIDTADPSDPAGRKGTRLLAPHLKRAYGIKPKLLADTGVYALGISTDKDRPERVVQQQAAFAALVEACARETGEPAVQAVAAFLRGINVNPPMLPDDFDPGATLTFRVDEVLPVDLPAVRAFWADVQGATESGVGNQAAAPMECVGCGRRRPALRRHPIKIKGIPGGQTSGTDLISANKGAFESYGLANSLIAPTCQACAEAYGNALNALLAGEETSLRVGRAAFVFWTKEPAGFRPKRLLTAPTSVEAKELIRAFHSAKKAALQVDPTAFYALGLSASGSRVVVRSWLNTTVGEAKLRLGRWFALQELIDPHDIDDPPLPSWRLANATVRTGSGDQPVERVVDALHGLALGGKPLPMELAVEVVRRCRAEGGVQRARAMLVKMVLGSQPEAEGTEATMARLDETNTNQAYVCGRLLAIVDAIQREALGRPNATVVDKFYGTASAAPAAVFGTLLHNAQNNLATLRKDPQRRGAFGALEGRLRDAMDLIDDFPRALTLPEQGRFALGYYHQQAADVRTIRERVAARTAVQEQEAGATGGRIGPEVE